MDLADLEPQFMRWALVDGGQVLSHVDTLAEASGIRFLCPLCFAKNHGAVGTHAIICWSRSRGVPDSADPKPGRWTMEGTGYSDLTLNGDPPGRARSILLTGGCGWHGFITKGKAT